MTPGGLLLLGDLGRAAANEPIYAGTIVFGIAGLVLAYLAFLHDEMDTGLQIKVISVFLLVAAIVSAVWPNRPWPH